MAVTTFAAIDVGSYELEMKIFEISQKNKIVMVDHIRHVIELGKDTYTHGKVSFENIDELCNVLKKFTVVMDEYQVKSYTAYATSAIREAENKEIILDRIHVSTGINVKVLSNSEQRFLCYKALSSREEEFESFIKESTAIVDVGAGSIQISLFDKHSLVTTQNIKLGSLRIRELLYNISNGRQHFDRLIEELINNDIQTFKRMFLKDRPIKNIIAIGEYVVYFARKGTDNKLKSMMSRKQFLERFSTFNEKSPQQISDKLGITEEQASLLIPCAQVYKKFIEETETENIWIPGVDLCDGIAAEYAIMTKKLAFRHDFQEDIVGAARIIAKRYKANLNHIAILEANVTNIFDAIKKYHGLGKRERLLLQISAILHDCGKYVSMSSPAECSYNIIMSTEIIGLSHIEREVVANVVKYNTMDLPGNGSEISISDKSKYLLIIKLTAMLRVANAMDRSHKQKFKDFKTTLNGGRLMLTTFTNEDITLEKGLVEAKAELFEEIYGIKPVLRQKVLH
ncbi:MAG: HD domain-containing protein [Lachnospiraceae bacterium]|nr:HD domain-containing protein [Lachnospiraceae bacterium]